MLRVRDHQERYDAPPHHQAQVMMKYVGDPAPFTTLVDIPVVDWESLRTLAQARQEQESREG